MKKYDEASRHEAVNCGLTLNKKFLLLQKKMNKFIMQLRPLKATLFLALLIVSINSNAQGANNEADYFSNIYLSLCMKNINNFEALRNQLLGKKLPELPFDQAKYFLFGGGGDAWPIPYQEKLGNFVLSLPTGKNMCGVFMRKGNPNEVEANFIKLVSNAPKPLNSILKLDENKESATNGKTHTLSYAWSVPDATKKMLFTLTTVSSPTADIQAWASATIISD